jgi:hypothetical protein
MKKFKSINQVKKYFFPESFAKEQKEEEEKRKRETVWL